MASHGFPRWFPRWFLLVPVASHGFPLLPKLVPTLVPVVSLGFPLLPMLHPVGPHLGISFFLCLSVVPDLSSMQFSSSTFRHATSYAVFS